MFSSSVDAGFVVALPFYRYLEPDCVGISMRGFGGGLCAKKMQEELMRELRDTTVIQKKKKKKTRQAALFSILVTYLHIA